MLCSVVSDVRLAIESFGPRLELKLVILYSTLKSSFQISLALYHVQGLAEMNTTRFGVLSIYSSTALECFIGSWNGLFSVASHKERLAVSQIRDS
jgi:hypothetical protein